MTYDVKRGAPKHEEFEQRLNGARLMTAEVLYYMPDHPKLLQTFLWQSLDVAPKYPRLTHSSTTGGARSKR